MAPKQTTSSGPWHNCIYCGTSYNLQGIDSHEQCYCKECPRTQTQAEQIEADAFARLVHSEINKGMSSLLFCTPIGFLSVDKFIDSTHTNDAQANIESNTSHYYDIPMQDPQINRSMFLFLLFVLIDY